MTRQGWQGWDEYAPFYDWENARTLGRRDVKFWTHFAQRAHGRVLELGCGTGRVSFPLSKVGIDLVGIDRSAAMLARARPSGPLPRRRRFSEASAPRFVRGDIRQLPFCSGSVSPGIPPYRRLHSLTRSR